MYYIVFGEFAGLFYSPVNWESFIRIKNEIGHIFRKFNVVEFKSPDDALSIDDYYKTIGYACLYKGLGETVNQIPANELTISIFRESYPREMFEAMKN
ncbi:hypothetical protein, partial [Bacteroides acidifaciens]|uniref:hypothetical protein n=1 Tax=Bacteroides acidifaciens TaxID=85831 RepID=UPI0026F25473